MLAWGFFYLRAGRTGLLLGLSRDVSRSSARRTALPRICIWRLSGRGHGDETPPTGHSDRMPFMANITPRTFIDDAGRKLYVAKAPDAGGVAGPSITEMLFALGLTNRSSASQTSAFSGSRRRETESRLQQSQPGNR